MLEIIENKIEPYLQELSLELTDIEYVSEGGYNYLRIYVENKERETTLDDCVSLSTLIDKVIDDLIEDKFYLEVSTPGLERRLRKEKDFLRFLNREIKIKTISNLENRKKFTGKLINFENDNIYIQEENASSLTTIPLNKVKEARLVYNLSNSVLKEVIDYEI